MANLITKGLVALVTMACFTIVPGCKTVQYKSEENPILVGSDCPDDKEDRSESISESYIQRDMCKYEDGQPVEYVSTITETYFNSEIESSDEGEFGSVQRIHVFEANGKRVVVREVKNSGRNPEHPYALGVMDLETGEADENYTHYMRTLENFCPIEE